jgi:hypothetical protein
MHQPIALKKDRMQEFKSSTVECKLWTPRFGTGYGHVTTQVTE